MCRGPRWRSCSSGVALSRLICRTIRSRGNAPRLSTRRPANSIPLVSTVVGAAAAQESQNLADIFQQKRLAPGHEDFFDAKLRRFTSDPLHPCEPQLPSRHGGRRTHAAVVAMQVTVEIRVEPKPRAHRPIVFRRTGTAPHRKTNRERPFSTVVSSSGFPVNRHHVSNSGPTPSSSPTTATKSPGWLRRSTAINSGSRPDAKVFRPISRLTSALIAVRAFYSSESTWRYTLVLSATYCALIHLSDPVSLTDTSVRKMCRGLPSAVPRCSVENSSGPAFL